MSCHYFYRLPDNPAANHNRDRRLKAKQCHHIAVVTGILQSQAGAVLYLEFLLQNFEG